MSFDKKDEIRKIVNKLFVAEEERLLLVELVNYCHNKEVFSKKDITCPGCMGQAKKFAKRCVKEWS